MKKLIFSLIILGSVLWANAQPFTPIHTGLMTSFGTWTHTNCSQRVGDVPQGDCVNLQTGGIAGSIVTPSMDFTTCSGTPYLTFKFRREGNFNNPARIGIEISTTGTGGPWTLLGNVTPSAAGWFTLTPYSLAAYSGNNNVALRFSANNTPTASRYPVIDDINIYCAIPPANDNCAGAIPLTVGGPGICNPTAGTVSGATGSLPASGCTGTSDDDVWYSFVATNTQQIIQVTGSASMDGVIELLSGACGALTSVQCRDATLIGGTEILNYTGLTVGNTYYVRVYDWYAAPPTDGTFSICIYENSATASNCSNPTAIACGNTLMGQTNVGRVNSTTSWGCHTTVGPPPGVITTDGEDVFYSVVVTAAGFVRITITGASGTGTSYLELISLGTPCVSGTCVSSAQLTLATGLFGNGLNSYDFEVTGPGTYYFVVDAQGSGSTLNYNIGVQCYATGIRLDNINNCGGAFGTGDSNQGIYTTWNGVQAPTTYDASLGGTFTVCENVYLRNIGWEWLKTYQITAGSCWTNLRNLTPTGNNYCFFANQVPACPPINGWSGSVAGNVATWTFLHPWRNNPPCVDVSAWGDGSLNIPPYTCKLYTFCFTADILTTCVSPTGLQNIISATDDGIGGGGGTLASNITVTYPWAENISSLPVHLIEFQTECTDESTFIKWTTASEKNNDYFTIERSYNGLNFEAIAHIEGAGNSNDLMRYVYEDVLFPTTVYYRLKQTDFDGTYTFSKIISATCGINQQYTLNVQDHTDDGFIQTTHDAVVGTPYVLTILDAQGNIVYSAQYTATGEKEMHKISTIHFSQGMYLVQISSSINNHSAKIMIK